MFLGGMAASFKQNLKNQEALEGGSVVLRCELSKTGVPVEWWKGKEHLMPGGRYQMKQDGKIAEMKIANVLPNDAGIYSCITGNHKSSAEVKVTGNNHRFIWDQFNTYSIIYSVGVKTLFLQLFRLLLNGSSKIRFVKKEAWLCSPVNYPNLGLQWSGEKEELF